jgi:hypothetical protein
MSFTNNNTLELELTAGTTIQKAIETAIKMASISAGVSSNELDYTPTIVWFNHNGIKVNVRHTDNQDLILKHWEVARWLDEKEIGKDGYQEITQEKLQIVEDAKQAHQNKVEAQRNIDNIREQKLKSEIDNQIKDEKFEVNDDEKWLEIVALNTDHPYSTAVVTFIDCLGRLLQAKRKIGETINKEACEKYSFLVSDSLGGLTGFQANTGINTLKKHWKYGYLLE